MKPYLAGQALPRGPVLVDAYGRSLGGNVPLALGSVLGANTVVTTTPTPYFATSPIWFDGKSRAKLEFYASSLDLNNCSVNVNFQVNGVNLPGSAIALATSEQLYMPFYVARYTTPPKGMNTFAASIYTSAGTATLHSGGGYAPNVLRVSVAPTAAIAPVYDASVAPVFGAVVSKDSWVAMPAMSVNTGDLLVLTIGTDNTNLPTVTDTIGNTYIPLTTRQIAANATRVRIWYCFSIGSHAANVTNLAIGAGGGYAQVLKFTGPTVYDSVDAGCTAAGGTSITLNVHPGTGPFTTTAAGVVVFCCFNSNGSRDTSSTPAGTTYVTPTNGASLTGFETWYWFTPSAMAGVNVSCGSGGSGNRTLCIGAFK